jgi:hypothetical protein
LPNDCVDQKVDAFEVTDLLKSACEFLHRALVCHQKTVVKPTIFWNRYFLLSPGIKTKSELCCVRKKTPMRPWTGFHFGKKSKAIEILLKFDLHARQLAENPACFAFSSAESTQHQFVVAHS